MFHIRSGGEAVSIYFFIANYLDMKNKEKPRIVNTIHLKGTDLIVSTDYVKKSLLTDVRVELNKY